MVVSGLTQFTIGRKSYKEERNSVVIEYFFVPSASSNTV